MEQAALKNTDFQTTTESHRIHSRSQNWSQIIGMDDSYMLKYVPASDEVAGARYEHFRAVFFLRFYYMGAQNLAKIRQFYAKLTSRKSRASATSFEAGANFNL